MSKNFKNFPKAAENIGCGVVILAACFGAAFMLLHDCFGVW